MKETSDSVVLVYDRSIFFPIAERLAEGCKKVYYTKPSGEAYETVAQGSLGDGHPNIQFISHDDWWSVKKEVDVFVFPDCSDWSLQHELEEQGYPVWGSKSAGSLEKMRGQWLSLCERLGLPMPQTEKIQGLTKLEGFCEEHEGESWFVKISRFRGDMETWETKEKHQVKNKLAYLRIRFGPLSEAITFYVQKRIDTKIESGSDSYNIFGKYPDEVIIGYEKKGESYFAAVRAKKDMPDEVWKCAETIEGLLEENKYANFVSSEVRVTDTESFWLDPCFRCPSPAGEEQLRMYKNFPDIVCHGANGELVQPEWTGKFCGEAVISYSGDRDGWKSIVVPEEIKPFVMLYANAYYDGAYHFPPSQDPEAIGCAVGIGDTPQEVLDQLKEIEEVLKDAPVELHIEPMADLFTEIEQAEKQGIEFTDKSMPAPADVLETAK